MLLRTFATVAVAMTLAGGSLTAQDIPRLPPGMTPEQARELLRQRPELGARMREWVESSGLSPAEIRQRLRERGYPANLLDQYMVVDTLRTDTIPGAFPAPTATQFSAIRALGVATPQRQDSLLFAGDTVAFRLYQDSVRNALVLVEALARDQVGSPLPLFGLETLRTPTTQFQPLVTGPVDDTYVLGPGDELILILTGAVELARTFEVTRDGMVVIPQVGRLSANGITLRQFRLVLLDRVQQAYAGTGTEPNARTRFELAVSRVRVQQLRVVGEVARPGTYQIAATGGVLSAIYEAGGLTANGNFREIQVRRGTRLVGTVDLYDYLAYGVVPGGLDLAPGDVIFVPVAGARIRVAGEVRRPAIYEVRTGESLRELLQLAGGLTAAAAVERATIARIVPPGARQGTGPSRTVVTVDLRSTIQPTAPTVPVFDGDSVTVFRITSARTGAVAVTGAVWQPGTYELPEGMRVWDALQAAGGVRPESYRGRVQVFRTLPDSSRRMLGIALGSDETPPSENPPLLERDSIVVYSRTTFRPDRWVAVGGAVQVPDTFAFADSMTLRDAVLLAGGVTDGASLIEAVVNRVRLEPDGRRTGETIRVTLDSSYVFDPTAHLVRPTGTTAPEFVLRPYDAVIIQTYVGWRAPLRVIMTGEVANPGSYLLLDATEHLSDLISRAGGLTARALPGGIAFFRARPEGQRRVGVDLAHALDRPRDGDDIILLDGDSIHIPVVDPTVRVEGAVSAPTVVPYLHGADIRRYVDAAGGFAQDADRDQTYVIQGNGIVARGGAPSPGSIVVVPSKDLALERPSVWPQLLSGIASIVATVTTIIIVLVR